MRLRTEHGCATNMCRLVVQPMTGVRSGSFYALAGVLCPFSKVIREEGKLELTVKL